MKSYYFNRLYGKRLARKLPPTLASSEEFKNFKILKSNTSLNTIKEPAVIKMDSLNDVIVCAGADGTRAAEQCDPAGPFDARGVGRHYATPWTRA